jgi:hypothetical protein
LVLAFSVSTQVSFFTRLARVASTMSYLAEKFGASKSEFLALVSWKEPDLATVENLRLSGS